MSADRSWERWAREQAEKIANKQPEPVAGIEAPATGDRKLLGHVGVDSGAIVVKDPCHEDAAHGLTIPTGRGDGVFPIYGEYHGKHIARVVVEFTEGGIDPKDIANAFRGAGA